MKSGRNSRRSVVVASMAAALTFMAGEAVGQDWRLETSADGQMTAALVMWPDGHAVVARCQGGGLDVYARLVEPADTVYFSFGQEETYHQARTPGGGGQAVFATQPGRLARRLAGGGVLVLESSEGRPTTQFVLPEDGAPVETVLAACGQPLVSARDDLPDAGDPEWRRRPSGTSLAQLVTTPMLERGGTFEVIMSCIVRANGRLEACEVEREMPRGFGAGEATLRAAEGFTAKDAAAIEGQLVIVPMTWRMP